MNDLIRRSDAENIFRNARKHMKPENYSEQEFFIRDSILLGAEQIIHSIPAVDAVEVVRCDACDWHVDVGYHYCNKWCEPCPDNADFFCAYGERPNCGADMREES